MKSTPLLALVATLLFTTAAHAGDAVQLDVAELLNARPIFTVIKGSPVPMTNNVDGAGGLATKAAVALEDSKDPHTMPDDAKFPANDRHPEIILPYANDDGRKPQARRTQGEDTFVITVPPNNYTKFLLVMLSGDGPSDIEVDLKYKDNTLETRSLQVPEWTTELPPDDKRRCAVASDLSQWNPQRIMDKGHHSLFGLDIQPNPEKTLVKIRVRKSQKGILSFFGATGELK